MKQPLDALIVLGGGIIPIINSIRAKTAAEYYQKNPIPIITTGYKPHILNSIKETEAETLKKELVRRGIPPEKIIMEMQSQNTYHNLEYSLEHLREIGAKEVGIVTNAIHMKRALKYARKIFRAEFNASPVYPIYRTLGAIASELLIFPWEIRGIIKEKIREKRSMKLPNHPA